MHTEPSDTLPDVSLQYLNVLNDQEQNDLAVNVQRMRGDVEEAFADALAASTRVSTNPVTLVYSGGRGAPKKVIDYHWLKWAITRRNTSDIARFLDLSRDLVSRTIVSYHLRPPGQDPFVRTVDPSNPNITIYHQSHSVSGPVSALTNDQLDAAVLRLKVLFPRAGAVMIKGSLAAEGQNVPRERVRQALIRVDPNYRLFERTLITRREYWVPGPNYLWHHDGQHGEFAP